MAKQNKEAWLQLNRQFLSQKASNPDVSNLGNGLLYRVLETGCGTSSPLSNSVVTCHYKGSLVDGRVFDNSFERGCPEAFRCRDLIPGFTAALLHMHVGDRWEVYIPSDQGYGSRNSGPIPGGSTLIFEIQLLSIG